jgi:hypothetical protein
LKSSSSSSFDFLHDGNNFLEPFRVHSHWHWHQSPIASKLNSVVPILWTLKFLFWSQTLLAQRK